MKPLLLLAFLLVVVLPLNAGPRSGPNIVTVQVPSRVHVVSGARIDIWITVYVTQQYMFWRGRWYPL